MTKNSNKKFPKVDVGKTVCLRIPDVDRSKSDLRNVLAYVLEVTEDDFYRLGTRHGVLKQLFARSEFAECEEDFLSREEIPTNEATLRTIATAQSVGHGQGMKKCTCKTKCENNRCAYRKNNVLCNSRCHQNLPCCNK